MEKQPKSKEGCIRQANAILSGYRRDFAGGGSFGYDWPTFRANSPERYVRICELRALYPTLPSRH